MKPVLVRKSETALQQIPSGGLQLVVGGKGPSIRELAGVAFGRKTGQKGQGWQRLGAIADLAGRGLSAAATTQQIADQMQGGNLAAPMGAYAQYLANQPWQFIERQKETQPQTQPQTQSSPTQQQPPHMEPVAPGATAPDGSPLRPDQMMLPGMGPSQTATPTATPTAAPTASPVDPAHAAGVLPTMPGQPPAQPAAAQPAQPAQQQGTPVDPAEAARLLQGQTNLYDQRFNRSAEPFEHAMDYLLKRLSR